MHLQLVLGFSEPYIDIYIPIVCKVRDNHCQATYLRAGKRIVIKVHQTAERLNAALKQMSEQKTDSGLAA